MEERRVSPDLAVVGGGKEEESARSGVVKSDVVSAKSLSNTNDTGTISPHSILDGKYLVGPMIGSGAFGLVYEAMNLELDEKVALKTMRPDLIVDDAMLGRFAREAKSAAAIKSEYVASVYDVGSTSDGVPYIVMEYLEGRNLGQLIEESGPLQARTAVEYALQICEALAAAHAKGIVHRDIKPENLLLTQRGSGGMAIIKVLDFGISKAALTGNIFGNEMPIVKTLNLVGTPLYMSPEQVRCSGNVDVRSDIWSLGMVLYELLAGTTAFDGASITEICAAILETKPKPIELHRNDLPSGLVEVLSKCLEKDATRRYQSVAELALALMPFGPKRSRLNVERAVTVLQSAGQVDPNLTVDSVIPPSSNEISALVSVPRLTPPRISLPNTLDAPASSLPPALSQPPPASKRMRNIVAVGVVILGLGGAGLMFGRRFVGHDHTTNGATTTAAAPEAPKVDEAKPTQPTTTTTTTTTTGTTADSTPTNANANGNGSVGHATTTPATTIGGWRGAVNPPGARALPNPSPKTTPATSPSTATPTPSVAAPPPATATTTADPGKGRTFRREF